MAKIKNFVVIRTTLDDQKNPSCKLEIIQETTPNKALHETLRQEQRQINESIHVYSVYEYGQAMNLLKVLNGNVEESIAYKAVGAVLNTWEGEAITKELIRTADYVSSKIYRI